MKARTILTSLFIFILTALPASAQDNCSSILKAELEQLSGITTVEQDTSGFMVIFDSADKAEAVRKISSIKSLIKNPSSAECNFSKTPIVFLDSNFDQIKSKTASGLSSKNIATLLYKYVYKLSPVKVDDNLKGYVKLSELSPQNNYYAARKEYYQKRKTMITARGEFNARSLKELRRDKNILDLETTKNFYLFITDSDTPTKAATDFMDKVAETTPKPETDFCIIAYNKNLDIREVNCPEKYKDILNSTEEELLMRHVKSVAGHELQKNINGYTRLKELNPSSTLYTKKLAAYQNRLQAVSKFISLNNAAGDKVFTRTSFRRGIMFATVSEEVLNGKSESSNRRLFQTLSKFYAHTGTPFKKCVLKNSAGKTLGTISCNEGSCSFR